MLISAGFELSRGSPAPRPPWWQSKAAAIAAAIVLVLAFTIAIALVAVPDNSASTAPKATPTPSFSLSKPPTTTTNTTAAAIRKSCDTLRTSSTGAIDAVNAYVAASNAGAADAAAKKGPAVVALTTSHVQVWTVINDALDAELRSALTAYVDAARNLADVINNDAPVKQFNATKGEALEMCGARTR